MTYKDWILLLVPIALNLIIDGIVVVILQKIVLDKYIKRRLLKDEIVIETVTLNKENNWEYKWEQIEASDEYSVKEINIPEGYTPTYKQIENTFVITNSKTLVQTGQMTWITSLLVITGLLFIIIGIVYDKKENNA